MISADTSDTSLICHLIGFIYHLYSRKIAARTYKDAIEHLNTLQIEEGRASAGRSRDFAILDMLEYISRISFYSVDDLDALNVIHVTGTKGKGSTCAFIESILRHAKPEWKIGLYTSPHLVTERERICINGTPISEELFATFFFEVWDKLVEYDVGQLTGTPRMPTAFQLLTLVAFHAFLTLKVDATVLEVGAGGTTDVTNVVPKPIVTAITSLGIEHASFLGNTLKDIAWHKSGIFKEGAPAFTVDQHEEGMSTLKSRARERKASSFTVTSQIPELLDIKLGLAGIHQQKNAALAVYLARSFLQSRTSFKDDGGLPEPFLTALKETKVPGRCQIIEDPLRKNTTWYLDTAHTAESIDYCIQWFVTPDVGLQSERLPIKETVRVLVFNCSGDRPGPSFLRSIHRRVTTQLTLHGRSEAPKLFFDHIMFCTKTTYTDGRFTGVWYPNDPAELKTHRELASSWSSIVPSFPVSNIHVCPSIERAFEEIERIGSLDCVKKVLVTGHPALVGGMIEVAGLVPVVL